MTINTRRLLVPLLAMLLVGGCETLPDQQRTQAEGAAVGAVLGGLLGYAIGGDAKSAAVGAALGGGAGYLVGNEIAERKQQYANAEDFLDAEIQRTAEFNRTTRQYNNQLRKDIATLDKESRTLQKRYQSGKASRADLAKKKQQLENKIAKHNQLEATLAKEQEINTAILTEERQNRGDKDPYVKRLDKENKELQAQIETLRKSSVQLANIDERLSV